MGYFKEYVNQNKYQDKKSNPITTISSLKQVKNSCRNQNEEKFLILIELSQQKNSWNRDE